MAMLYLVLTSRNLSLMNYVIIHRHGTRERSPLQSHINSHISPSSFASESFLFPRKPTEKIYILRLITPNMFLNNSSFLKISQNPIGIAIFQSPRIADKFEFYLARFSWTANCVVKYIRTRQDKLRAKSSLLSAKKVSPFWN